MRTGLLFRRSCLLALSLSTNAWGDTSLTRLGPAFDQLENGGQRLLSLGHSGQSQNLSMIVRLDQGTDARSLGLVSITSTLAVGSSPLGAWQTLSSDPLVSSIRFSPARHPLLDLAGPTVRLEKSQEDFGLRGEGTIVGVVDTGIDASHPAFLDADGESRIAWLLAFEREALGLHPDLEELYGCTGNDPCAIYSRQDIEELLESGNASDLPQDSIGHGTHVASLAAGFDSDYPGIAPLSDLVIVAAAGPLGGVEDSRILLGTHFVFNRASAEDKPAVVNVSLGSSFGAHDGSSAVEEGLAALAEGPGRALVIASGNSGHLDQEVSEDYPGPFGIHTEVAVPEGAVVRIPILTSLGSEALSEGGIFVWISTREGDELAVGFHNGRGEETSFVSLGESVGFSSDALDDSDDYDLAIIHGVDDELEAGVLPGSVVVALAGSWKSGRVFELVLKGSAHARLWLTATGTAGLAGGGPGPLFPRGRSRGTVAIPGTQGDLITVGATLNRSSWTDYTGELVGFSSQPPGRAFFSSAGPNQLGQLKPELVAPGESVIGAMARAADPRDSDNLFSLFSAQGTCPDEAECYVIDDDHGIASGTSMAAPIVTGAVALLMQREPELTMAQAKLYLMTGAQKIRDAKVGSLVGTGELNIVRSLLAQDRSLLSEDDGPQVSAARSRVVWADSFLLPSPQSPLEGFILLRDEEGIPTYLSSSDLSVSVEGPGHAEWSEVGAGLIEIRLYGEKGAGAQEVQVVVSVEGSVIKSDDIPIALDPILARYGFEFVGSSCQLNAPQAPISSRLLLALLLLSINLVWLRRRRSH